VGAIDHAAGMTAFPAVRRGTQTPDAAALEVDIAAKAFAGTAASLASVRFAIDPGEVVALLGASGSGKSTTLRIALGLDHAFRGRVVRRYVRPGVVFQDPRLLPWLSVMDNLRLVAGHRGDPAALTDLLGAMGLPDVAARMPRELSLGMARRVALARALAVEPDFLVLDEPFASLDPSLSTLLGTHVARWARARGTGVLLATHDAAQALRIADRLLILAGTPTTLAEDLRTAETGDGPRAVQDLADRFPFLTAV
jgi:ABC-type nitrate/sulfonate/bicarbonate transport system ATPase subunit